MTNKNIKFKIFQSEEKDDLEKELNEFCADDNKEIIDVQFSTGDGGLLGAFEFIVLVSYKNVN